MRQTENKFAKSIGAGLASLTGSKGRSYFVIQHRTTTDRHKLGENQEIVVDMAEIGRSPECAVRFGEDVKSVSRKHAVIIKRGTEHIIRQLSGTNQTIVNGRPVNQEWFLKHGDEIELSHGGPKLGFLIPENPSVGSIPLTRRFTAFRQQALRPYRQALTAVSAVFLVAIVGLATWIYLQNDEIKRLASDGQLMQQSVAVQANRADSLERANAASQQTQEELRGNLSRVRRDQRRMREEIIQRAQTPEDPSIEAFHGDVYFIMVKEVTITLDGETSTRDYGWTGTGFLLDDGRFVTARHVVEPWFFLNGSSSEADKILNMVANNGGQIKVSLNCFSPTGRQLQFTNSQFRIDRGSDQSRTTTLDDGRSLVLRTASAADKDWATVQAGGSGGLSFAAAESTALPQQTKLYVLGYPLGIGANSPSDVSPIYSTTEVGRAGLDNGIIITTDRNFDHGNSGGPVFKRKDDGYTVVGIISAGRGDAIGVIVPISAIN